MNHLTVEPYIPFALWWPLVLAAVMVGLIFLGNIPAVVFALAPLVGTPLTTSAKFAVVSKSPLTDRLNDALASDRFALDLKGCGVDALVLHGRASVWSLLVVEEGTVHLEPAAGLVGLSAAGVLGQETRRLPDDVAALYSQFGVDLVRFNGNDSWSLPMPARFVLNQKGKVVSAEANPDYTHRPEPSEIVEVLKKMD